MSSASWCEKNKSEIFKDNKIAQALRASTIRSLKIKFSSVYLQEKSYCHLLIICMKKASQKILTDCNYSTSRYFWFIWNFLWLSFHSEQSTRFHLTHLSEIK